MSLLTFMSLEMTLCLLAEPEHIKHKSLANSQKMICGCSFTLLGILQTWVNSLQRHVINWGLDKHQKVHAYILISTLIWAEPFVKRLLSSSKWLSENLHLSLLWRQWFTGSREKLRTVQKQDRGYWTVQFSAGWELVTVVIRFHECTESAVSGWC